MSQSNVREVVLQDTADDAFEPEETPPISRTTKPCNTSHGLATEYLPSALRV